MLYPTELRGHNIPPIAQANRPGNRSFSEITVDNSFEYALISAMEGAKMNLPHGCLSVFSGHLDEDSARYLATTHPYY